MITVYPDMESLSKAAAEMFAASAAEAIDSRKRFFAVLSGGATPRRTYELLASPPYSSSVDWSRVHVFWSDERCVPPDDKRSNERMARLALLDKVPIPPEQVHPVRCETDPHRAALEYEHLVRRLFGSRSPRFDLVLLGLGPDGHTASLFPHTPALAEVRHWTATVLAGPEELHRVTLAVPLLNQARKVLFLVAGVDKSEVLREVLEGPREPDRLPAQLIRPEGDLHWLIDQQAASLLRNKGAS